MINDLSRNLGADCADQPLDCSGSEFLHGSALYAYRVVMVMANPTEAVRLRSVYRGELANRPATGSSLMVKNTVALPTYGSSSLSASAVKLSCFCSKRLAMTFLGAVAL